MPFVEAQGPMPALDLAFPDVCKTPIGPVPVPIPYPNLNLSTMGIPTQFKTLLMCMPAHNLTTFRAISFGDNPGVLLGMLSSLVMAPGLKMMGSTNLLIGGPPATKLGLPTKQNGVGPNAFGMSVSPAQIKVISLR